MLCSDLCLHAQGLSALTADASNLGWDVDIAEIARLWKGGAKDGALDKVHAAYTRNPSLSTLLVDPTIASNLSRNQLAWRRIVTLCFASGLPCPALSSSLTYFDAMRRPRLSSNLVSAYVDYEDGVPYTRVDRDGDYNTEYAK
jgi:6-phosphogluconate dehydrogenase